MMKKNLEALEIVIVYKITVTDEDGQIQPSRLQLMMNMSLFI